jgi:hypothetical protein
MVVLRCTQKLAKRIGVVPAREAPASSTRLGDWYGTEVRVGRKVFALFISEHDRVPVVLEAGDLRRLPASLTERLRTVLTALGVEPHAVADECAEMGDAVFAPTQSRSLLGTLNDFSFMMRATRPEWRAASALDWSLDFAETPVGPIKSFPDRAVRARLGTRGETVDAQPINLVLITSGVRGATCLTPRTTARVRVRARRLWDMVPGEIVTVRPWHVWHDGDMGCLSGEVLSHRIDVAAIGLRPLGLTPVGEWNPAEEYWGEDGEPIEWWARPIIARGPRPAFEMEPVLLGLDLDDPVDDPITEAIERRDAGDTLGALEILDGLVEADLRCIDAHVHLGNLWFDHNLTRAMRHYDVGLRIGELALGPGFDGVLPWGFIDNRPYLRALFNFGLCLWRLERFDEAAALFTRVLWLNPSDNQGARMILPDIQARRPWRPDA